MKVFAILFCLLIIAGSIASGFGFVAIIAMVAIVALINSDKNGKGIDDFFALAFGGAVIFVIIVYLSKSIFG